MTAGVDHSWILYWRRWRGADREFFEASSRRRFNDLFLLAVFSVIAVFSASSCSDLRARRRLAIFGRAACSISESCRFRFRVLGVGVIRRGLGPLPAVRPARFGSSPTEWTTALYRPAPRHRRRAFALSGAAAAIVSTSSIPAVSSLCAAEVSTAPERSPVLRGSLWITSSTTHRRMAAM